MRRLFLPAFLGLIVCAVSAFAFDAPGTILKVDPDKHLLHVHAGGQDRTVTIDKNVKILGTDGKPLADGLKAMELKEGAEVTITVERVENAPVVKAIRLGKAPTMTGKRTVGLKPLTEMTASDRYKGEDGGLYGAGRNEPPEAHHAAARKAAAMIQPLDADGKPDRDGVIGFVSVSMSNATQEFSVFKQIADRDPDRSARVTIVDCAQGGQAMAQWVDPHGKPWTEASRRLEQAHLSPKQVEVVWIKLANIRPTGALTDHGKKLEKDTLAVIHNTKVRFPNCRIILLSSRIYAGYATTPLNPEPYAYEGAFVVRWLIQDQMKGNAALNYDPEKGAVNAPVLLWGPYLWGDGTTPRKEDGLVWERKDLAADGTHPSESGRRKVADMILKFCKSDPYCKTWFVK